MSFTVQSRESGILAKIERYSIIMLILGVFLFSIGIVSFNSYGAEKVVNLRFAHFVASGTTSSKYIEGYCKEVEERTNGRVKITQYPGGTLMPSTQVYDGITRGIADIGNGIFTYHRGRFPLTEVIDLPLGYKKAFAATKLINEYYKKFKPKELDDVKVLYLEAHGPGIFHAKKPIHKLEDLRGMKLRCSGLSAKIVIALGGTAVSLPITDAYDALSKGVVEGTLQDIGGLYHWGLGDLLNYHIQNYGTAYTSGIFTVMNKDKWNALPSDIQKIIDGINEEWVEKLANMWDKEWDGVGRDKFVEKGHIFITLSEEEDARWKEKVKVVFDNYVKDTKEKGLPGDQVLKFCLDYLKVHNK